MVGIFHARARFLVALFDALATDAQMQEPWRTFVDTLAGTGAELLRAERRRGLATPGPDEATLMRVLIGMNIHAAEMEARRVVATGTGTPGLADALTEVFARVFYGTG